MLNKNKGFTLVEILIVLAIIAILAALLYVAINPAERLKESRDSQRLQEAEAIAAAIRLYKVDHNGDIFCEADGENGVIGIGNTIDSYLADYFAELPVDPKYADDTSYKYYLDNFACCVNPTTGAQVDCTRGAVVITKFESEKYQDEIDNYDDFCPSGSVYGGEATGSRTTPAAYFFPILPSCYSE